MTTIFELRDRIITDAIASVHKYETFPEKIRGCLHGLELCRDLETPVDFEALLAARQATERQMRNDNIRDGYWEYRCATAQVEFVWERLRIVWGMGSSMVSGHALMQLRRLLG